MRTRLALAFALVALVSIVSMVLALRLNAAREVRTFMYGGGMVGLENLVVELEDYYHHNGAIEQILSNLLTNALRHTPDGGRIGCSLAASEHGIPALSPIPHSSTTSVLLTIHDTGPGIPPDALPHLFERFYRADPSCNRLEGGTGLGLAIARQLAEAHGGALVASNRPQGGAVFTLTLPVSSGGIADTA